MKSGTRRQRCVILAIAAMVVSVSVSGCQTTTARQATVMTRPPPVQALASDGDRAFERALSLAAEERNPEAREALDRLMDREPGHPRARLLDGVLHAHEGRVGNAIEILESLVRDHPEMSAPYNNLAVLYTVEGRLDDARKILLATLEHRADAVAYANLGHVYTKLAHDAHDRARELDTEIASSVSQRATPFSATSEKPARVGRTGSREDGTQLGRFVDEPHQSAPASEDPALRRPYTATEPQVAAPQAEESVVLPPTEAAALQVPATRFEGARTTTETIAPESEQATGPDVFCVDAAGIEGHHAAVDATLWLQSVGAKVIGVRYDDRRIASGYQVYLPPFESREQAVAKLRQVRDQGVRDVALIPDGELANAISFGFYRNVDNMHRRVAALEDRGHSVRSRTAGENAVRDYAIKALVSGSPSALHDTWTSQFPQRSIRVVDCG